MTEDTTDINITKQKKLIMTQHKTDIDITKIEEYKKLNSTEHKKEMNNTKIEKYKKLNSNSMTNHKTDINITEKLSTTFTLELKTEYNYTLVNQTIKIYISNKPRKSPHKRLTKIFNQQLTSIHYLQS